MKSNLNIFHKKVLIDIKNKNLCLIIHIYTFIALSCYVVLYCTAVISVKSDSVSYCIGKVTKNDFIKKRYSND